MGISLLCGFGFGFLMDWPLKEVLVAAGAMTVTSSAIIAKVLVDLKRTANPETELILGIVMADDIFLAVYLSIVSGFVLSARRRRAVSSSPPARRWDSWRECSSSAGWRCPGSTASSTGCRTSSSSWWSSARSS